MLFNTFDFGLFLVVVYTIYWIIGVRRRVSQNILLLVASYVFYGLWDWRFLSLIFLSSVVDYAVGIGLESSSNRRRRKFYLSLSIIWNLGVLIAFKYFNFFLDSFAFLFSIESISEGYSFWNVILPVGLSFYTFQTMSYSIDVYRKRTAATRKFTEFLCFVSFFPQLVAGPIERAGKLLPQFIKSRNFDPDQTKEGLRQILWGLFKKIIVAEKLAIAVDMVFDNPGEYGSLTLVYAGLLFSYQLYCDFSGYTDIAIGTARLFGFKLTKNFDLPYIAKSATEFWKRWHITLTKWFTDYVYVSYAKTFRRISPSVRISGLLLTMLLVGLWHGANWTFVVFGLFNGIMLVLERIPWGGKKNTLLNWLSKLPWIPVLIYTHIFYTIIGILFRSEDMDKAMLIFDRIISLTPDPNLSSLIGIKLGYFVFMIIAEVLARGYSSPLQWISRKIPVPVRWAAYYVLIVIIIRYAEPREAFIYFQF